MNAKAPPQIPNYRIVEKLGEGGMASVWLAQRDLDHRMSVVKVLHEHLSNDRVVRSRFLREAQAASLLDHPNIAKLYDAGLAGTSSYLAMEFIPGEDVESMMMTLARERKLLPPELSITVTLRVLEGLHYAHEFKDAEGRHLEIVHRDLSPRNVMVSFDGEVKVIDFGLVRMNLGDFRTAPGMIAGTLRYMSPEQATADKIDRRSDIYTWSVVLYELLTGRPIVTAKETRAILGSIVVDVPPLLSTYNPTLPKALDAVLAKALEKDPEERFQTALEYRDALALAAGELGVASAQSIGEFVTSLFPDQKAQATRRLESVELQPAEGPAFENTRVARSEELPQPVPPAAFEPTVAERPRPIAPPRKRSKAPWGFAAVALAIGIAAVVVVSRPNPLVVEEPMPPPPEEPHVESVTVRPLQSEEPRKEEAIASTKLRPKKRATPEPIGVPRPPPVSAPPPPKPATNLELYEAFVAEANEKLGEQRAKQLYTKCGLATAMALNDGDLVRRALADCRAQLEEASK